jgi:copper homeostasis protein
MNLVREVCVESFDEAVRAVRAGATRIELCENLGCGGTTPSYGTIKKCREKLGVPVMVMIRPRGGDFVYSEDEFAIMQEDILQCRELEVTGVVLGILTSDGHIDQQRTQQLVQLAEPLQVTFHKAIDISNNLLESVSVLKQTGINRILTSGGQKTAIEGKATLNRMIQMASPQIGIIVAGKVTFENLEEVRSQIPSGEFHGRKLVDF